MSTFSDNIQSLFEAQQTAPPGSEGAEFSQMRRRSFEKFAELGLPSLKNERWKYTNVRALENEPVALASDTGVGNVQDPELAESLRTTISYDFAESTLVFIDGIYAERYSEISPQHAELTIASIAARIAADDEEIRSALNLSESELVQSFAYLNTSLVEDGAFIRIPAHESNGQALGPIQIVFVDSGSIANNVSLHLPRLIIETEDNTSCQLIETHITLDNAQHGTSTTLTNAVTDIRAGNGSSVEHYRLQFDRSSHHIAAVNLSVQRDARISSFSIALGGSLSRIDVNADLLGTGAHVDLNGIFFARDNQHIDHHTRINHASPHTTSNENYKGIAADRGRGVFNGKIYVAEGAQKISAIQSSKNILLDDGAEIDTKPELEIYADDVQCAHGATVGQLSENELFYLQSRGIDISTARSLLTQGFTSEVIEQIEITTLRNQVDEMVKELVRTRDERNQVSSND